MPNVVVAVQDKFIIHDLSNKLYYDKLDDIYDRFVGTPSRITIDQKEQIRTDLRDSLSVLNRFSTTIPERMKGVFGGSYVSVGVGSRHCYLKNKGFMKEHVDIRLADEHRDIHVRQYRVMCRLPLLHICYTCRKYPLYVVSDSRRKNHLVSFSRFPNIPYS